MAFSWVTSSAIEFTSNGVKVMGDLSKASKALGDSLKALQATVDGVIASLDMLSASAIRATDALVDLNAATGKSNTAQTRSTTRVTRAAAAYDAMAVSAARAAEGVASVGTASAGSRLGLPRGGGGGGIGGMLGMLPGPLGVLGRAGSIANTLTGGALGHLAEGGAAIDALYEAGHYQAAMQSIKNITGSNSKQMDSVNSQMFNVGNATAMSPTEAAKMFREIARMSQGSMSVASMQSLMPLMAKAQTVIGTTRGYSPEKTTDAMMSYVHLMRLYDPKKMPAGFDLATRFFELIPNAPQQAIRQLSYFVPQLKNLGVPDVQQDALMLTLARAGYGQGKGGTGLADLVMQSLGPLQVTSFAQAQKSALLKQAMLTDSKGVSTFFNDKAGGNIIGMLDSLAKLREKLGPLASTKMQEGLFGIQGARIGDLLSDPTVHKQIEGSVKALGEQKSIGLNSQFSGFMGTFDKQSQRAAEDFQASMTELGRLTLPAATMAARGVADALFSMTTWLRQNPKLEHDISQGLIDMVASIGRYFSAHKADFIAIGKDLGDVGMLIGELAHAASSLVGPLTKVLRIVTDIATLHWSDLPAALGAKPGVAKDYVKTLTSGGRLPLAGQNTNSNNTTVHIEQHFTAGLQDPAKVKEAARAGAQAALDAAKQKARTYGALFAAPNVAPLAGFGPAAHGTH